MDELVFYIDASFDSRNKLASIAYCNRCMTISNSKKCFAKDINKAELFAFIFLFEFIIINGLFNSKIIIYTDSMFVVNNYKNVELLNGKNAKSIIFEVLHCPRHKNLANIIARTSSETRSKS